MEYMIGKGEGAGGRQIWSIGKRRFSPYEKNQS